MIDEEVLAFIEMHDENLKDMVTGLLFERQGLERRIKELENEVQRVREAKLMIYNEKKELQIIFDNFVEAVNAKITR